VSRLETIDDPADPRLDDFRGLRDEHHRRWIEPARGIFLAEGATVVRRLLASGHTTRAVVVTPARWDRMASVMKGLEVSVYRVPREVLAEVAGFDLHRGVIASAERPPDLDVGRVLADSRMVVVLEGINDHENLGAIFRSSAALGADAVVLDPTCADPYYRRSVRVSMGGVLVLPFARSSHWPTDLELLRSAGFELVALTLGENASALGDLQPASRTALLLGAEGPGLAPATLDRVDHEVTIPMSRGMDSLNVGHAAAIAIHHLAPKRSRLP
jgi:tRNA G18 (ribose-2'-O)-methylase SpoU